MPTFNLFGFSFNLFDILTGIGIFLGIRCAIKMAQSRNLPRKNIIDAILVSIIFGFLGAHWMHILLYQRSFTDFAQLFQVWKGISSTGGLLAGGIACWIFLRVRKLSIPTYGDCVIGGVLVALFCGRMGCWVAFDHPGSLSNFFLATELPDYGRRHNLGMYEAIILGTMLVAIYMAQFRDFLDMKAGRWVIYPVGMYGIVRFGLDFLRATDLPSADPRYAGLTPAQYVSLLFVGISIYWYYRFESKKGL